MKKIVCFWGACGALLAACSTTTGPEEVYITEEAPALSAYYGDWDKAVRADVDLQNMYVGTPEKITKPIDMYMAMALALKYNYTRRLASYRENLIASNISPAALPTMAENLGYENASYSPSVPSDLKVSWNLLDVSSAYYQNGYGAAESASREQTRKVVNNILLEARSLYWKALAAQRLIPVIDDMNEYLVRVVDEINACTNDAAKTGKAPSTNLLLKKRKYLESIKQLNDLKRKFDTAQAEFAGLLGMSPYTTIKLAGAEYGNFSVPAMRAKIQELEWLALTNRPELLAFDGITSKEELELVINDFDNVSNSDYRQNPNYYNRKWSKSSNDLSMNLFEDIRYQGNSTYNSLARQRMTHIILNQVYLSWALFQSAVEDYYLNLGVATTSEDIAESFTINEGENKAISHLEAARAIIDEAKAYLSYIDVQEAIGRLYASIGMDPISADMLNESPSNMATEIRSSLEGMRSGIFSTSNSGSLGVLSARKPAVNLSSHVSNIVVGTGSEVNIKIPNSAFEQVKWSGPYSTYASSLGDEPLPSWLSYSDSTHTFTGRPQTGDEGDYRINVLVKDEGGNSGIIDFKLTVDNMYVQTMEYKGLTGYRRAKVYQKCIPGKPCAKNDI